MVRRSGGLAVRVVVEGALSALGHARAAVFHRLLSDRESALVAELYRREQVIPGAGRGGFHRGAGAAGDPSRAPDGTAHETDLAGIFQSRDAEPMAAL